MRVVKPLSWFNVLGYGLGDMANNFAFSMGTLFLLNYYTDVAGIPVAAAGTMLAAMRIYEAIMDMIAGRIIDRTSTRYGRFRPFLLCGSLPLMRTSIASQIRCAAMRTVSWRMSFSQPPERKALASD